jgi:hypothetical protein
MFDVRSTPNNGHHNELGVGLPRAKPRRSPLFDYLVGKSEERRRYFDPNCAGSLQIDRERQPRWLLKWQIGNFCAFQKAVSILRSPAVVLQKINAIGHQRPIFCLKRESMNCGQFQRYASFDNLAIVRAC